MIRWLRDLINLFRRPIGRNLPNYGEVPERLFDRDAAHQRGYDQAFGDGREEEIDIDYQLRRAHQLLMQRDNILRKFSRDD